MSFDELVARMDRTAMSVFGERVPVVYLSGEEDAEPVSTTPDGKPLTGIFDEQYVLAKSGNAEAGVSTLGPAIFFRLEDLPTNPEDENDDLTLTIRGVDYYVNDVRPDGMGGVVLTLHKVV